MRNYDGNLNNKIKASLQQAYDILNKDKEPEKKYALFDELAELYLITKEIRDYPKVVAIYQYMMKLQPESEAELEGKIASVEEEFIKKANGPGHSGLEKVTEYKKRLEEFRGIENSEQYGESVRARLKGIEDLGIVEGQEELDEEGLKKRAEEVEKIYMGIREFFIGEGGLIKDLISDCIKDLGGLPKIKKGTAEEREVEYAIFGMGSMALGTMTPWSDMEFGILIEDGLGDEEKVVKEYFRNLTSLLHIRVINFGETPLRMMGIEELNNFKSGKSEDDWFFDELINSGFSFDGPHAHACKTPLGRQGFKDRQDFELIGTVDQFMEFYEDTSWSKDDPHLLQALGHLIPILGASELLTKYSQSSERYNEVKQTLAFELLKEDSKMLDPFNKTLKNKGQLLNVKKEIYRFPDRMVVALGDCLGGSGNSNWELVRNIEGLTAKLHADMNMAVSLATELRLKTYANNDGQKENLSVIARYESSIEELKNDKMLEQIFYLKDIRLLYRYYYKVAELSLKIVCIEDKQTLREINQLSISDDLRTYIKGVTHYRFLKYYDAIVELEKIQHLNIPYTLGSLYSIVGRLEEALQYYLNILEMVRRIYNDGDHYDVAASLNIIGTILRELGRYEEALQYHEKSLEMVRRIYKDGVHSVIATIINNLGNTLERLGKYEEALLYQKKSLKILRIFYKDGDHPNTAIILNSIGVTLNELGKYKEALQYHKESLELHRRIYKGDHDYIATSLYNVGISLSNLGRYEEALQYYKESLEVRRRIYKDCDHSNIAVSLHSVGNSLQSINRYEEALQYYEESLEMHRRIYKGDHSYIAITLNSVGVNLRNLGRYEEALKYCKEGLEMHCRIYKGDHSCIASALNNAGDTLGDLGRYEEALEYHKESMGMIRRIYNNCDHSYIVSILNNIGNTLERLGRYEEALLYRTQGLEMGRRIFFGDRSDIAAFLNSLGNNLRKMGRYEEALKYNKESLEMQRRIYKDGNHSNIAVSLCSVGITLMSLGRYEEALEYGIQADKMRNFTLPAEHPCFINIGTLIDSCSVYLANKEILLGNFDKASTYYSMIGMEVDVNNLPIVVALFAFQCMQNDNLGLSISCFEALNKELLPQDIGIKKNLACMYHAKAIEEKNKNQAVKFTEFLGKAREISEKALIIDSVETVEACLYTEYAQFLIRYHDKSDMVEYKKIVGLLENVIMQGDGGSVLGYGKIEKETVVAPLQEVIDEKGQIVVRPHSLACYLLCKVHLIHSNYHRAMVALERFSKIEEKTDVCEKLYKSAKQEVAATMIQKSWREYIKKRESEISVAGQTIH